MADNDPTDSMDCQEYEPDELLLSIKRLGYEPLPDGDAWAIAIQTDSREDTCLPTLFVSVCTYLVNELCETCGLAHSKLQDLSSNSVDTSRFSLELRTFLSEYGAPFAQSNFDLIEQPSRKRMLIDYLVAELEACKMCQKKDPKFKLVISEGTVQQGSSSTTPKNMTLLRATSGGDQSRESERARALRVAAIALGLPKPPPTITCAQLFDKFEARIHDLLQRFDEATRNSLIGRPLLSVRLTDRQNAAVLRLISSMNAEYSARRAMLIKRFELTVNAFSWSEVIEKLSSTKKEDPIGTIIANYKTKISAESPIGIAELLAARDDVLRVEKSSSDRTRVRTDLNRVRMGAVPDRGGRAWEVDPPERETFAKQQRQRPARGAPRGGASGSSRPSSGYGGNQNRGGGNFRNQHQQHQHQQQYGFDPVAAAGNPYATYQNAYAYQQQPLPVDSNYYGQAYDGPGYDQQFGGQRGRGRGGRGRVQRGRPY